MQERPTRTNGFITDRRTPAARRGRAGADWLRGRTLPRRGRRAASRRCRPFWIAIRPTAGCPAPRWACVCRMATEDLAAGRNAGLRPLPGHGPRHAVPHLFDDQADHGCGRGAVDRGWPADAGPAGDGLHSGVCAPDRGHRSGRRAGRATGAQCHDHPPPADPHRRPDLQHHGQRAGAEAYRRAGVFPFTGDLGARDGDGPRCATSRRWSGGWAKSR
jgi:hypothetical protein